MAQKEWRTVSVRIDETEHNALQLYCKMEGVSPNKAIRTILGLKLEEIIDPDKVNKSAGIPQVGMLDFSYDAESDTMDWNVDVGSDKILVCDNMSPLFVQSLINCLTDVQNERDRILEERKGKVTIPKKIMGFKIKNVSK